MSVIPGRAVGVSRGVAVAVLGLAMLGLQIALRGEGDPASQVVGQLVAFAIFVPAAVLAWRGVGLGRIGLGIVVAGAIAFRAAAFRRSTSMGRPSR